MGLAYAKDDISINEALQKIYLPILSTEQEKLEAIEILKEIPTNDAVIALESAILMARIPTYGLNPTIEIGPGQVAFAAAKALGQNINQKCREILTSLAKNERQHENLRIAAIYGLGGLNRSKAIETLLVLLNDPGSKIRLASLSALKETLGICKDLSPYQKRLIIEGIFFFYFYNFKSKNTMSSKEKLVCRLIFSSHSEQYLTDWLMHLITERDDEKTCSEALEVLVDVCKDASTPLLLECLVKNDRPATLYSALGAMLSHNPDSAVKTVAREIHKTPIWFLKITGLFLPELGHALIERHRAARRILAAKAT